YLQRGEHLAFTDALGPQAGRGCGVARRQAAWPRWGVFRSALAVSVPSVPVRGRGVKGTGVNRGLLFPHCGDQSLAKAHRRDDITTHGFRSTFRDWAAERTNFPREVIEMAMGHVVGDETEEAYFRSDLLQKRRPLMNAWAAYCAKPVDDAAEDD